MNHIKVYWKCLLKYLDHSAKLRLEALSNLLSEEEATQSLICLASEHTDIETIIEAQITAYIKEPVIVFVVGSKRFLSEILAVQAEYSSKGYIVLDNSYKLLDVQVIKTENYNDYVLYMSLLTKIKVDMSDIVYVVNKDGYVGENTKELIQYASQKFKTIEYLENLNA